MSNQLPAEALTTRRALINNVDAASKALHTASRAIADNMGLVGKTDALDAERADLARAEAALAAFYAVYPLKTYRREFAAESKAYRGRV